MSKQFKLEHVGDVTINDVNTIKVHKTDGTNYFLGKDFDVMIANFHGNFSNDTPTWMTFNQFIKEMTNGQYLQGDAEKAFFCWIEMYYVQCHLNHDPTCMLNELLWEKTYEFDGAVTEEEKALCVAGWHVFTDGKEYAIIWSSEGCCKEIVPLTGKEIVYMSSETAVIKL